MKYCEAINVSVYEKTFNILNYINLQIRLKHSYKFYIILIMFRGTGDLYDSVSVSVL